MEDEHCACFWGRFGWTIGSFLIGFSLKLSRIFFVAYTLKKIRIRENPKKVSDVVTIWNPFWVSDSWFPSYQKPVGNQNKYIWIHVYRKPFFGFRVFQNLDYKSIKGFRVNRNQKQKSIEIFRISGNTQMVAIESVPLLSILTTWSHFNQSLLQNRSCSWCPISMLISLKRTRKLFCYKRKI